MEKEDELDHPPIWYWAMLCSLTTEEHPAPESRAANQPAPADAATTRRQRMLFAPEVSEASTAVLLLKERLALRASAETLEHVLQVWIHNCFEHSESPLGCALLFVLSLKGQSGTG